MNSYRKNISNNSFRKKYFQRNPTIKLYPIKPFPMHFLKYIFTHTSATIAQLAGAVEYTDCISAEE